MICPRTLFVLSFALIGSICFAQEMEYESFIAPIIKKHCVKCHQRGGIGPMPFEKQGEVESYAQMIQFVTESNYMPPWKASGNLPEMLHQNVLSESEIELLRSWVHGEHSDMSSLESANEKIDLLDEFDYDFELKMAEPFEQYDIYYDQFQVFVIPFDLGQDTFVQAIQFIPGDATIVRSCQVSITLDSSEVFKLDEWDPRYGYNSFGGLGFTPSHSHWFDWSAGDEAYFLGNRALKLPAKGYLLMHIHYGPTDQKRIDQSSLRLKFAPKKPSKKEFILETIPLINESSLTMQPFLIKPNERINLHAKTILEEDILIHRIYPQCNLFCQSIQIFAKFPNKRESITLLKINDWDFKWRRGYFYKSPIFLPAGTEIHAFAAFDNSTSNLSAPSDKASTIKWGDQMFQDMMLMHFTVSNIQD